MILTTIIGGVLIAGLLMYAAKIMVSVK